jgi:Ca2+-binding EF-hand superfamily protein
MKSLTTILSALALTASVSFAEDKPEQKPAADAAKPAETAKPAAAADKKDGDKKPAASPEERFKKLDKNNDGSLDLSEIKGKKDDDATAEKKFKALDKNGDGKISLEEFTAGPEKKPKKDK